MTGGWLLITIGAAAFAGSISAAIWTARHKPGPRTDRTP